MVKYSKGVSTKIKAGATIHVANICGLIVATDNNHIILVNLDSGLRVSIGDPYLVVDFNNITAQEFYNFIDVHTPYSPESVTVHDGKLFEKEEVFYEMGTFLRVKRGAIDSVFQVVRTSARVITLIESATGNRWNDSSIVDDAIYRTSVSKDEVLYMFEDNKYLITEIEVLENPFQR